MHRCLGFDGLPALLLVAAVLLDPGLAYGRSATPAPPLPAPAGTVVNVSTEPQLQSAVRGIRSNTTIVLAPGMYVLTKSLSFNGRLTDIGIRGATTKRDDVVLAGPGMTRANYGNTPDGVRSGGDVQGLTIANLTLKDFYRHPIIFNAGTERPHVYNVHLIDAGQQFIKSNPDSSGGGVNDGVVEYSILEYTTTARDYYTNGIDVHTGANWIIRHNLFRNIVAPSGQLAGPAILMWNRSSNTLTEGNTFVNCARGISYGLIERSGHDHSGGIIRNNVFYRSSAQPGDTGIHVADSPNTQVLNNTLFLSGTYSASIEYRYAGTTGVVIANNLLDGVIRARDGATGTELSNRPGVGADLFVNVKEGDFHLVATATTAIDRGVTVAAVTRDWDGDPRPHGEAYDIGADEFESTSVAYQIRGPIRDGRAGARQAVTRNRDAEWRASTNDVTSATVESQ